MTDWEDMTNEDHDRCMAAALDAIHVAVDSFVEAYEHHMGKGYCTPIVTINDDYTAEILLEYLLDEDGSLSLFVIEGKAMDSIPSEFRDNICVIMAYYPKDEKHFKLDIDSMVD